MFHFTGYVGITKMSAFNSHKIERMEAQTWRCAICLWKWKAVPTSLCPGVPRYTYGEAPPNLVTAAQLKQAGLKENNNAPGGCIYNDRRAIFYWLYNKDEAAPRRRPTEAQLKALEKARTVKDEKRRTCPGCKQLQEFYLEPEEICPTCHETRLVADHRDAAQWAGNMLAERDWVILDTETTGLDATARIVQVAVVAQDGRVLFESLVNPGTPIPEMARRVHKITDEAVGNAPTFAEVYPRLKHVLADCTAVLAYNAQFDEGVINGECRRHAIEPLKLNWRDVMNMYSQWCGEWSSRHKNYKWQPLAGNHDAVGDCRAVLEVLRNMASSVSVSQPALW